MIQKYSSIEREAYIRTAGIEDAYSKYYSDIPRETFNTLVSADPSLRLKTGETPKKIGTFGQWILKLYQEGATRPGRNTKLPLEDLPKLTRDLTKFLSMQSALKKSGKPTDINQFKSPQELFSFVNENKNIVPPKEGAVRNDSKVLLTEQYFIVNHEAELVYEDETFKIITPLTYEASKFYSEGTDWCTHYPEAFKDYSSAGLLYILISKQEPQKERFQFHFERNMFMNYRDSGVPIADFFYKKFPKVSAFFQNEILNNTQKTGASLNFTLPRLAPLMEENDAKIDDLWSRGIYASLEDGLTWDYLKRQAETDKTQISLKWGDTEQNVKLSAILENIEKKSDDPIFLKKKEDLLKTYKTSIYMNNKAVVREQIVDTLSSFFEDETFRFSFDREEIKVKVAVLKTNIEWKYLFSNADMGIDEDFIFSYILERHEALPENETRNIRNRTLHQIINTSCLKYLPTSNFI